ncbi:hypothetical protein BA03_04047 [Mycobacterium tuberculosis NRITLD44]|nr:hypothetical protein BA03_04047 [Mycobacterium tuberculosis NRITLD44]
MSTLGHTSNLYATEPGIALAEELVALLGADQRPVDLLAKDRYEDVRSAAESFIDGAYV